MTFLFPIQNLFILFLWDKPNGPEIPDRPPKPNKLNIPVIPNRLPKPDEADVPEPIPIPDDPHGSDVPDHSPKPNKPDVPPRLNKPTLPQKPDVSAKSNPAALDTPTIPPLKPAKCIVADLPPKSNTSNLLATDKVSDENILLDCL